MKRFAWGAALSLASAIPALAQSIEWIKNYEEGLKKAKAENRAVLLYFTQKG